MNDKLCNQALKIQSTRLQRRLVSDWILDNSGEKLFLIPQVHALSRAITEEAKTALTSVSVKINLK